MTYTADDVRELRKEIFGVETPADYEALSLSTIFNVNAVTLLINAAIERTYKPIQMGTAPKDRPILLLDELGTWHRGEWDEETESWWYDDDYMAIARHPIKWLDLPPAPNKEAQ